LFCSATPGDDADREPEALVPGSKDPGNEKDDRRPGEQVEGRRAQQMADDEDESGYGGACRGHELTLRAGAELSREQCHEHDHERHRNGRDDAQSSRRLAEDRLAHPSEQRGQGRLVVVAERRMSRGCAEVELVPVVAVAVREQDLDEQVRCRDRKHEPGSERCARSHGLIVRY
jgi:hypothetical protein